MKKMLMLMFAFLALGTLCGVAVASGVNDYGGDGFVYSVGEPIGTGAIALELKDNTMINLVELQDGYGGQKQIENAYATSAVSYINPSPARIKYLPDLEKGA